jgi:hypothetical protein
MILRKADTSTEAGVLPSADLLAAMTSYNEELQKAGVMLSGDGLKPSSHGVRVRLAGKKLTVVDGPFAETKELVAGFSLLNVKSKDEAIEWVERWPSLDGNGHVELELRQLYELSDFPVDETEAPDGWREQERRFREAAQGANHEQPAATPAAPAVTGATGKRTRFIVMLKSDRATESGALPKQETFAAMGALMDELARSGALLGGEGLKPSARGARVRLSPGKRTVVDGPFAETKELIAGYSMIAVSSMEEAIDFAKRWLHIHADGLGTESSEIEIRPLYELSDF